VLKEAFMPAGGKGKPAGGYHAGKKGSHGCKGYPTVSADGTVHGCHDTKQQAAAQARAIWASVNAKKGINLFNLTKADFAEGDFVIVSCEDEVHVGRVEYVMTNGASGLPGSEYYLETSPENPALIVRTLEFESDGQYWEETVYLVSVAAEEATKIAPLPLDAEALIVDGQLVPEPDTMPGMGKAGNPCWEGYVQRGMKEKDGKMVPNCVPVSKSDQPCCPDQGDIMINQNQTYKTMWGGSIFDLNPFAKRDYTVPQRRRMAASGEAMPDGSYPIANKQDLMNAIRSWGRGGSDPKVKAHIKRRARALNAEDMIPESWK
jgi:hypothetical protein